MLTFIACLCGIKYLLSGIEVELYPPLPTKRWPEIPQEIYNEIGFVYFDESEWEWKTKNL